MKRSLGGFSTLTALALLLFLAGLLAIGASTSTQLDFELKRAQAQDQRQAWGLLDDGLSKLKETWKPTEQTFGVWAAEHPIEGLTWESLSGKINLNTTSLFLLALPEFRPSLKGISVEKFLTTRTERELFTPSNPPTDLVTEAALLKWFTIHSLWNVNTADEAALEQMVTIRSGSAAVGSALRTTLRGYRGQTKRIGPQEFATLAQSLPESLKTLLTIEPELNVNDADAELLKVFASNPAWNLNQAEAKVQTIADTRRSRPWTKERLQALLQLPEGNLLSSYWGVTTRFLGGQVDTPQGTLEFVVFLPGETPTMAPWVIDSHWSPS